MLFEQDDALKFSNDSRGRTCRSRSVIDHNQFERPCAPLRFDGMKAAPEIVRPASSSASRSSRSMGPSQSVRAGAASEASVAAHDASRRSDSSVGEPGVAV